ncbi:MAG TPA: pyridoxamine 5'-phosphate oxidase [Acidimicrobiia bacterium]|nr:pyridoxamine 5'-phosphate oxidase [Acidimicrobiia bacterium]
MAGLSEHEVDPDPFVQFTRWYEEARAAAGDDADAMVVATATADGAPSARVVLLRGVDDRGLCFYTNYDSQKGRELAANPRAALVLHWPQLHRQVRATGEVSRLGESESAEYWRNRPPASRLSAWASQQSEPITSRDVLEAEVVRLREQYGDDDVPLPPFWGGYRVTPDEFEFWQHRDDRLHDRVRYRRVAGEWVRERLAP